MIRRTLSMKRLSIFSFVVLMALLVPLFGVPARQVAGADPDGPFISVDWYITGTYDDAGVHRMMRTYGSATITLNPATGKLEANFANTRFVDEFENHNATVCNQLKSWRIIDPDRYDATVYDLGPDPFWTEPSLFNPIRRADGSLFLHREFMTIDFAQLNQIQFRNLTYLEEYVPCGDNPPRIERTQQFRYTDLWRKAAGQEILDMNGDAEGVLFFSNPKYTEETINTGGVPTPLAVDYSVVVRFHNAVSSPAPTPAPTPWPSTVPSPSIEPSPSPVPSPSPSAKPSPSPIPCTATGTRVLTETPSSGGTVTPGSGEYPACAAVNLTATPDAGQLFVGWTIDGAPAGWANPLTLTMNSDHQVQTTFVPRPLYPDVTASTPYAEAITQLAARGIIHGYEDGTFGPADLTLRAQMAALIGRAMGWDQEDHNNPFNDRGPVDDALWRNVGTLAYHGVARGYGDNTYDPTGPVLNAQVVSFVTRAMIAKGYWALQPDDPALYPNVPADSGHRQDIATYVHYAGILPGTANPGEAWTWYAQPATRSWFAEVLWRALDSYIPSAPTP
jgi:hypothetical protein